MGPLARNPSQAREALIGHGPRLSAFERNQQRKGLFVVVPVISSQQNCPWRLSLAHAKETKQNADRRGQKSEGSIVTFPFLADGKFDPAFTEYQPDISGSSASTGVEAHEKHCSVCAGILLGPLGGFIYWCIALVDHLSRRIPLHFLDRGNKSVARCTLFLSLSLSLSLCLGLPRYPL